MNTENEKREQKGPRSISRRDFLKALAAFIGGSVMVAKGIDSEGENLDQITPEPTPGRPNVQQPTSTAEPTETAQPTATSEQPTSTAEPTETAQPTATSEQPTSTPEQNRFSQEQIDFLASHEFNSGDRWRNTIMMTYDDSAGPAYFERIMNSVERYGGKVTFFVPGTWLIENADSARDIVARGHLLEFHGWDHTDMARLTEDETRKQIVDFLSLMSSVLPGYAVKYIRFPYGSRNEMNKRVAAEYGLQSVMWGVESGGKDETTYNNVVARVYWGAIVLSHTAREFDIGLVEKIMDNLHQQGFVFETVDEGKKREDTWTG